MRSRTPAGRLSSGRASADGARRTRPVALVQRERPGAARPELAPVTQQWLRRYKLRAFGSVALHLVYAAIGAIDLVLDHRAAVWDVVAGAIVLLEAGGVISDTDGCSLFPVSMHRGPVSFVAGNPAAHAEALTAFRALRP